MASTARSIATFLIGGLLVVACTGSGAAPTGPAATPGTPTPGAVASAAATPAAPPAVTPVPTTDGQGPEHFSGIFTSSPSLLVNYKETKVGDVIQNRGGVATWTFTTNDPRMAGTARWAFSIDEYGTIGPQWGTIELTTGIVGKWTGPCSGAAWASSDYIDMGCWLVGGGAYKDFTAYFGFYRISAAAAASIEGIIYKGSPPKP